MQRGFSYKGLLISWIFVYRRCLKFERNSGMDCTMGLIPEEIGSGWLWWKGTNLSSQLSKFIWLFSKKIILNLAKNLGCSRVDSAFHLSKVIKSLLGTPRNVVLKSKLYLRNSYTAVRRLDPIHKKGPFFFSLKILSYKVV